jgi:hypothetical protein
VRKVYPVARVKTVIRKAPRDKSAHPKPRARITLTMPPDNAKLVYAEAKRLKISVSEYIRIRLNLQEVLDGQELDGISLSNKELDDLADKYLQRAALMAN